MNTPFKLFLKFFPKSELFIPPDGFLFSVSEEVFGSGCTIVKVGAGNENCCLYEQSNKAVFDAIFIAFDGWSSNCFKTFGD